MTKFTILGCGSSLGSPWITNNWGKLNKKNPYLEKLFTKKFKPKIVKPKKGKGSFKRKNKIKI